ncbi:VENN motif pre-toxin domain-containing protein, partial [Frederiksenia canicola]
MAAGVGEAGAHYLTQALYGTDNPESLTEAQKKTIADLSKVAGGVAAGLASSTNGGSSLNIASNVSDGMGIAESAVENNLLSREDDEYVFDSNELFDKNKSLDERRKVKTSDLLIKDGYINHLIKLYQEDPNKLNLVQRNYLNTELTKIAKSYDIPVTDLYNWDFNNSIKRDDSKLSSYLALNEYVQNQSYEGKQAKSFAVGMATVPVAYGIDKFIRLYPQVTEFIATNPIKSEAAVVFGYNTGKSVGEGTLIQDGRLNSSVVEDIVKDTGKTIALGKLSFGQQVGYGMAVDYLYEVNKHNATDHSIKTEMVGSVAGSSASVSMEGLSKVLPKFNGAARIITNTI